MELEFKTNGQHKAIDPAAPSNKDNHLRSQYTHYQMIEQHMTAFDTHVETLVSIVSEEMIRYGISESPEPTPLSDYQRLNRQLMARHCPHLEEVLKVMIKKLTEKDE